MADSESKATRNPAAYWFWFAIVLLWAGIFCNRWYARQSAGAKVELDKIQAGLNRQNDGLKLQNAELSRQNSAITHQIILVPCILDGVIAMSLVMAVLSQVRRRQTPVGPSMPAV